MIAEGAGCLSVNFTNVGCEVLMHVCMDGYTQTLICRMKDVYIYICIYIIHYIYIYTHTYIRAHNTYTRTYAQDGGNQGGRKKSE
jgi:hypothetical protein